jgi:hypothetical protein
LILRRYLASFGARIQLVSDGACFRTEASALSHPPGNRRRRAPRPTPYRR